jgi:hypothetical protein
VGSGTDTVVNQSNSGTSNSWVLIGANAGTINGAPFSGFANLTGGTGNDRFAFHPGASVSGRVNGNGGSDTLDWLAYRSTVTVNLASKTATGLGRFTSVENLGGERRLDADRHPTRARPGRSPGPIPEWSTVIASHDSLAWSAGWECRSSSSALPEVN